MKRAIRNLFILSVFLFVSVVVFAQQGNPPPPPPGSGHGSTEDADSNGAPLGNGLFLMAAMGLGYAVKKNRDARKNPKN